MATITIKTKNNEYFYLTGKKVGEKQKKAWGYDSNEELYFIRKRQNTGIAYVYKKIDTGYTTAVTNGKSVDIDKITIK